MRRRIQNCWSAPGGGPSNFIWRLTRRPALRGVTPRGGGQACTRRGRPDIAGPWTMVHCGWTSAGRRAPTNPGLDAHRPLVTVKDQFHRSAHDVEELVTL